MTKEIAEAFGLQPESLESVVDDEHQDKPEHCQSCASWAKKYAELEAVVSARNEKEAKRVTSRILSDNQDFCL